MAIFKKLANRLIRIKEKEIDLEKDIQKITENNLKEVFNLEYVSSEFTVNNLRIDTLCFDEENKTFVIIEYKKDRNFSVIDQGFAYLALMLNNKAEFLLEYNEKKKGKRLDRKDIDWSQCKVIFISPFFTLHQKAAINFKNLPIELWEVHYYENNLVEFDKIEPVESSAKIETITKDRNIKEVAKDIKQYDFDWHFKKASDKTKTLFNILRERILNFGNVKEGFAKFYIGYSVDNQYFKFCTVHFYKSKLTIFILVPDRKITDPKHWLKKIPPSYGWAKNLKYFEIDSEKEIPYAVELIKQAYDFNKNR